MSTSDDTSDKDSLESESSDLESNSDISDARSTWSESKPDSDDSKRDSLDTSSSDSWTSSTHLQAVTRNIALVSGIRNQSGKNRSASVHWPLYQSFTHLSMNVQTCPFLTAIFFYISII